MAPGLDHGWTMILGADALGRSVLARLVVASRNTIAVASLTRGLISCTLAPGAMSYNFV